MNTCFAKYLDTFIPEIMNNVKNLKEQLKGAHINCETNKSAVYTIHKTLKYWTDANFFCKAKGSHFVLFETVYEYNHLFELEKQQGCDAVGFWTCTRDLGDADWVWSNSGERVFDDFWRAREPSGDRDSGEIYEGFATIPFSDVYCWIIWKYDVKTS